jgi:cytochrome c-type biogenesis protein CcmF
VGNRTDLLVQRNGEEYTILHPERRVYVASGTPSTEMAIDSGFLRDLFITLGEQKESGAWSMTLYIKPFVRWIWLGAIFMALGGSIAAADKRYRRLRQRKSAEQTAAGKGTAELQPAS